MFHGSFTAPWIDTLGKNNHKRVKTTPQHPSVMEIPLNSTTNSTANKYFSKYVCLQEQFHCRLLHDLTSRTTIPIGLHNATSLAKMTRMIINQLCWHALRVKKNYVTLLRGVDGWSLDWWDCGFCFCVIDLLVNTTESELYNFNLCFSRQRKNGAKCHKHNEGGKNSADIFTQGGILVMLETTLINKITSNSPPFCGDAKNHSRKSNVNKVNQANNS